MRINKKNMVIFGLICGIMIFFIGIACNIAMGPSSRDYLLPYQVSQTVKLTGMGILCISMIIGGIFIEDLERDTKALLLIFGILLLLLNIFILSYSRYS